MAVEVVHCPHCQRGAVGKYGTAGNGQGRLRCQNAAQGGRTFLRDYPLPGARPVGEVSNGGADAQGQWRSRYRPRVAGQSAHGQRGVNKKASALPHVNQGVVEGGWPAALTGEIRRGEAAEVDERWSV